jgi:hypothetical protein
MMALRRLEIIPLWLVWSPPENGAALGNKTCAAAVLAGS